MVTERAPAMPVYVKDIYTDEGFLSLCLAEQGLYFRLLAHQWLEGSIPSDIKLIVVIVGRAEVKKLWRAVARFFPSHPTEQGRLQNAKLEIVRANMVEHRRRRSLAGAKGAAMTNRKRGNAVGNAVGNAEVWPSTKSRPAFAVAVAIEEEREILRAGEPPAPPEAKPDWNAVERILPVVSACSMKLPPDEQILGMLVGQFGEGLVEEVFRCRAPDLRGKGWQYARKILENWKANPNERPSSHRSDGTDGRTTPPETRPGESDRTSRFARFDKPGWRQEDVDASK